MIFYGSLGYCDIHCLECIFSTYSKYWIKRRLKTVLNKEETDGMYTSNSLYSKLRVRIIFGVFARVYIFWPFWVFITFSGGQSWQENSSFFQQNVVLVTGTLQNISICWHKKQVYFSQRSNTTLYKKKLRIVVNRDCKPLKTSLENRVVF